MGLRGDSGILTRSAEGVRAGSKDHDNRSRREEIPNVLRYFAVLVRYGTFGFVTRLRRNLPRKKSRKNPKYTPIYPLSFEVQNIRLCSVV